MGNESEKYIRKLIREVINKYDWDKDNVAGQKIIPNNFVYHISEPSFRDSIYNNGLKVNVGDSYSQWVKASNKGQQKVAIPAIFATNDSIKNIIWDGFSGDLWEIDTKYAGNEWHIDNHFSDLPKHGFENPHIVTFKDISKNAIKLVFKGGQNLNESLFNKLELQPNFSRSSGLGTKLIYLSLSKSYAQAYANGETSAAHVNQFPIKNGVLFYMCLGENASHYGGDVWLSGFKDDIINNLTEYKNDDSVQLDRLTKDFLDASRYTTEEVDFVLSYIAKDDLSIISPIDWSYLQEQYQGYSEVCVKQIDSANVIKVEVFKDGDLVRTIKGKYKGECENVFYHGSPLKYWEKLLKESVKGIEKWEVVFTDCGDNETIVNEKFNSEKEAVDWAEDKEYDFQDEYYNGEDYMFKTFYRYYNPEDKQSNYFSYEVRLVAKKDLKEAKKIDSQDYIGKDVVFRGAKSTGAGYYTFDKNLAAGYVPHGGKVYKLDITGKEFANKDKIMDNGEYVDEIARLFPDFFDIDDYTTNLKTNFNKTKYYNAIKFFLLKKGYDGIIDRNNNELFIY